MTMGWRSPLPDSDRDRFRLGLLVLVLVSLTLHLWGLGRFNTLVFDEIYYAKFAAHYLQGQIEFGGHPPLSTYMIAGGIWLFQHLPFTDRLPQNGLTGVMLSPLSYRWVTALAGSFFPGVVALLAYQLGDRLDQKRRYALVAGFLATLDGFFLVETRYALINIYLVIFGLCAHILVLWAVPPLGERSAQPSSRSQLQTHLSWLLAGLCFGASVAVKWNGLGFLLGLYLMGAIAHLLPRVFKGQASEIPSLWQRLRRIHLGQWLIYLGLVPAIAYYLAWVPWVHLDPSRNFWDWQHRMVEYHQHIGGADIHPYCSAWYTWVLMIRPIAYFYKTAHGIHEPPPLVGPPLPNGTGAIVYDVHAIGNPALWWLSTAAIVLLISVWIWSVSQVEPTLSTLQTREASGTATYLVINWAANYLPWMLVSRCVFLYHYMSASVFALLAIAWMIERWLGSGHKGKRLWGISALVSIVVAFGFWLPLYFGLPLTPQAWLTRLWFRSWI